jgi:ABC-type nitrate/sulfonate/bicarbonate transport system substrate-binding protein
VSNYETNEVKESEMRMRNLTATLSRIVVGGLLILGFGASESRGESLKLGVSTLTYGHSPLWVAQRKGFYGQEGLDLEIPALESGSRAMQALLGGSTQLVATTPEDLIRATEAGTPTVILAGVLNALTHSLVAGPKFKRAADLRGGKVAASSVTGSVTYALKLMLAKNDLHYPKDYIIIQIGGSGVRFAALKGGGIDAALVAEPLALVAEEAGLSNIGFVGDYLPKMQVTVVGARSDWAKANRDVVVRYLKGLVRTFRWLHGNKEEGIEATSAVAKVEKKFGARGHGIYTARQVWPIDGNPTIEGMKVVLDSMHADKILATPQRPEKYLDLSYLNEALKQLPAK